MKTSFLITIAFLALFSSCGHDGRENGNTGSGNERTDTSLAKKQIAAMLDSFNLAAANAEFERYFGYFTEDAVFIGSDATEHWDKKSFMAYAKPHFDRKKTWNFTSLVRHIYPGKDCEIAWMDELLETPFAKICRGSGVLVKRNHQWKIQQYVLSMTVPNRLTDSVRNMKASADDSLLRRLKGR